VDKKATIPDNIKELYKEFLTAHTEFIKAIVSQNEAQGELEDAENLKLKETADNVKTRLLFIRNKMFSLHLRLNRIFSLLTHKQKDFHSN